MTLVMEEIFSSLNNPRLHRWRVVSLGGGEGCLQASSACKSRKCVAAIVIQERNCIFRLSLLPIFCVMCMSCQRTQTQKCNFTLPRILTYGNNVWSTAALSCIPKLHWGARVELPLQEQQCSPMHPFRAALTSSTCGTGPACIAGCCLRRRQRPAAHFDPPDTHTGVQENPVCQWLLAQARQPEFSTQASNSIIIRSVEICTYAPRWELSEPEGPQRLRPYFVRINTNPPNPRNEMSH
eukprot:1159141-Pelagomonas_calceolata.AAC.2